MKESMARFGWFWCNDEEMFPKDPLALDRKMKKYADQGITHVILFGITHFRWAFRPHWAVIRDCLRRVCECGHKYGIKVIEHHSAILSYYPYKEEYLKRMENLFRMRSSSPDSWENFREYQLDMEREDRKWIQIEGSTGKNIEAYGGVAICPSNDDFIRVYLEELEKEYASGLDGIMTDDVQFYGACGCESCRRKFQEKTSYTLPEKDAWQEWFGDTRNASFRAWMQFRHDIVYEFHCKVKEHYRSLGKKMLRPNYTAGALYGNYSCGCVENAPELHWIFQECMFGSMIRYSFPGFMIESIHRRMVGKRRNIPYMMMFYAEHPETLRFTWALARLAGAMYTNAPRNGEALDETLLRKYEKEHAEELFDSEMMSQVAFLDSLENRKMDVAYEAGRNKFFLQSCCLENLPCDLVGVQDQKSWKKYPLLCVIDLHVLKEKEICDLLAYVEDGGTLLLTGTSGILDDQGARRSREEWERLWGIPGNHTAKEIYTYPRKKGKILTLGYAFGYPDTEEEAYGHFEDFPDFYKYGAVYKLMEMRKDCVEVWTSRFANEEETVYHGEYQKGREARKEVIKLLTENMERSFDCQVPELVLVAPWKSGDGKKIFLRLLNASNCLDKCGEKVSHEDMPPFPAHKGEDWRFRVELAEGMKGTAEFEKTDTLPFPLPCSRKGRMLEILLPPSLLHDFGVIRIG